MTTALERGGQNGRVYQPGQPLAEPEPGLGRTHQRRGSWFAHPAWPIVALLAGWPLWWALGVSDFIVPILSVPMLHRMYMWRARRTRTIKVPPGFGLWLLFLVVMVAGVATLSLAAPDTILTGSTTNRTISWGLRAALYLSATVALLYAGNLTEEELPRRRIVWLLALLGIYTIGGGLAGVAAPGLHFTSPLAYLVPSSLTSGNVELASMLHPALTQLQTFEGRGRPQAPFTYSNGWGNEVAILLPWMAVVWMERRTRSVWQRRACSIALAVAIVPILLSYDRGLWIGIVFIAVYLIVRSARMSLKRLALISGAVLALAVIVLVTPVSGLISERLSHGSSNSGRAAQSKIAWEAALASPIIGFGDTRHQQGSTQSIAVGRTAGCSDCGQQDIGSHGQFWLLLIANGFPGTFCFMAFFAYGCWRYRKDRTPYGQAGVLVILLGFLFSFVYLSVGITLALTMIAYAVLWRNDIHRREELAAAEAAGAPGPGRGAGPVRGSIASA